VFAKNAIAILASMNFAVDSVSVLRRARSVLATEASAIAALEANVGAAFVSAVQTMLNAKGRVVVTGIGKSGHVGRKLAATLASTGTPAFFVHPAEASHGDLGMISAADVVIALSNSGEVAEVNLLLTPIKRTGAKLIAITGNENSTLAKEADIALDAHVNEEACPLGLAPTASTAAAMALGDALAMALLEARGFTAEDFARSHPGGSLGRKLITHVRDVMRTGDAIPAVALNATLEQALFEITGKGMGMTVVLNDDRTLAGIYTDGDLRRTLPKVKDFSSANVADFMTRNPVTIGPNELAVEAVSLLEETRKTQLAVVNEKREVVGALHMHDLLRAKVV
jgi:arabinose-5-phosphate isomerase